MKPYGLERGGASPRPNCPCCRTKYHGQLAASHDTLGKRACRKGAHKRARQAWKKEEA